MFGIGAKCRFQIRAKCRFTLARNVVWREREVYAPRGTSNPQHQHHNHFEKKCRINGSGSKALFVEIFTFFSVLCRGHFHFLGIDTKIGPVRRAPRRGAASRQNRNTLGKNNPVFRPKKQTQKNHSACEIPNLSSFSKNMGRYFYPETYDTTYHTQPNFKIASKNMVYFFFKITMANGTTL